MAVKQQPLDNLENQQALLNARNNELETLQGELQTVQTDAMALLDPSLYHPTQSVTSSNSSAVSASLTSSNGAVQGGYAVSVTALAQSAQRTFTFSSANADTFTIDGQAVSVTAGESAADFASSVNSNSNLDVYATATQSGNIVLSNRATGQQTGSYIQVVDSGGTLAEITADANPGQDAAYDVRRGVLRGAGADPMSYTDALSQIASVEAWSPPGCSPRSPAARPSPARARTTPTG
jgi:flagellar capping protein FliD